jgi:hypothetical protein
MKSPLAGAVVGNGDRYFLGHNLGPQRFVSSTVYSVDDVGPDNESPYTIFTRLPPTVLAFGRSLGLPPFRQSFGLPLDGVNCAYLIRRRQSAIQEEADYGLSVAVLAIGAEFAYNSQRLADALKP